VSTDSLLDLKSEHAGLEREVFSDAEQLKLTPMEYRVKVWDQLGLDLVMEMSTFYTWQVEGEFLITWDAAGLKRGTLLTSDVGTITTEIAVYKEIARDEEGEAGDDEGEEAAIDNGQA
jgi:hypothetical protein